MLVENSGAGISVIGTDGTILFVNREGARGLGGKPDEFIGRSLYDVLPEDEINRRMKSIREIIESGEGHTIETVVELPTGKRWFTSTTQAVRDSTGNISCIQSISQDITERKHMEDALRLQGEITENMSEGVYLVGVDDLKINWSR